MKSFKMFSTVSFSTASVVVAMALMIGCTNRQAKSPDVEAEVAHALNLAGLTDIGVSQDREKGVVTLTGNVATDDDRMRAESIAQSIAGPQVVSDEIGVRPNGDENTAKKVDSDLDSGIGKNLDAMLLEHRLKKDVSYDVTNGVVTLKGDVRSESQRASVEKLAQQVPNVRQVVNEIDIRHHQATSTNEKGN